MEIAEAFETISIVWMMTMITCGIIAIALMALRGLMNTIKRRLHLGQAPGN